MPRGKPCFATPSPLPSRPVPGRPLLCLRPTLQMAAATAAHTLNGKTINGPMQPVNQNVLVKIAEVSDTTTGGLILTGGAKEKPTYGEAVEVGPGKRFGNGVSIPMNISKGDYVMYGKYGGTDVDYDGEKHTIITQDDVLCKLSGGKYEAQAVQPIFDRVFIKVDEVDEETASGIVLAKTSKEKPTSGKIVAMGPGRFMENGETEPLEFAVGDTVLYGKYGGTEVQFDGEEYMLVRTSDIFAKY